MSNKYYFYLIRLNLIIVFTLICLSSCSHKAIISIDTKISSYGKIDKNFYIAEVDTVNLQEKEWAEFIIQDKPKKQKPLILKNFKIETTKRMATDITYNTVYGNSSSYTNNYDYSNGYTTHSSNSYSIPVSKTYTLLDRKLSFKIYDKNKEVYMLTLNHTSQDSSYDILINVWIEMIRLHMKLDEINKANKTQTYSFDCFNDNVGEEDILKQDEYASYIRSNDKNFNCYIGPIPQEIAQCINNDNVDEKIIDCFQ